MKKWKAVRVKQELVDQVEQEVEKSGYKSLSNFVSDAIQLRLQTLAKQRVSEYLERDKAVRIPPLQARMDACIYTLKHIWASMTPEGDVEVGITDYFQDQVKEIVNIRTDVAGVKVSKDQPFGVAESWWFTYDLYSPLNGRIIEVNQKIIDNPFILNADSSQWLVKIQPESTEVGSWMKGLLTSQRYQRKIAQQ